MLTVTFDELQAALSAAQAPVAAAEAHGALCGSLAAAAGFTVADWLEQLLPEAGAGAHELRSRNLLERVYDATAESLDGLDMEFAPLLPDDAQPLARRVDALAEWCAGFLWGLGSGAIAARDRLSEEVAEVLRDFGEISRAVVDRDESPESSETSYAELVEYLRAGAQLTYEELALERARMNQ
ncbi:MAG TPA: UPF0149 family protein [Steroidobacteraceae bacterium]|nr:UPF0149 family protein [Steroidobacteraceae bacterium]